MTISRRALLTGALAAPVLVKFAVPPASAKAPTPSAQMLAVQHVRVGDSVVTAISDGHLEIGVDVLSNVTPDEAADLLRQDFRGPGPVTTGVNAYVVHLPDRTVLIDAGGAGMTPSVGRLLDALSAADIAPEDIDAILLTHMHADHIGALVTAGATTFANAEIHVHRLEVEYWTDAGNREAVPDEFKFFFDAAQAVVDAYGERVRTFSGESEVVPGITSRELFGHTPGHSGFRIGSGEDALLVWGDIVHIGSIQFARPDVGFAFDTQPDVAIATRQAILQEAANERFRIAGMHIAFPGIGHVVKASDGNGYDFEPADWQYDLNG